MGARLLSHVELMLWVQGVTLIVLKILLWSIFFIKLILVPLKEIFLNSEVDFSFLTNKNIRVSLKPQHISHSQLLKLQTVIGVQ